MWFERSKSLLYCQTHKEDKDVIKKLIEDNNNLSVRLNIAQKEAQQLEMINHQLHHPQGFNTLVEAFKKVETQVQQEPSEQHKNAPGKEGTRKPK